MANKKLTRNEIEQRIRGAATETLHPETVRRLADFAESAIDGAFARGTIHGEETARRRAENPLGHGAMID